MNADEIRSPARPRRSFFKILFHLAAGVLLWLNPVVAFIRRTYAESRRIILPKGTEMTSLVDKNPAELDTRNLDVSPLAQFETMGLTDHITDLNSWRLTVSGEVKRPLKLTYEQVLEIPSIERNVILICPGFFTNHGKWKGISVLELFKLAEADSAVTHVTFRGPPGRYEKTDRFPMAEIAAQKVFLAYQVNGQALPRKHGFPLRVVAEDHYGAEWVKFVHKVEAFKAEG